MKNDTAYMEPPIIEALQKSGFDLGPNNDSLQNVKSSVIEVNIRGHKRTVNISSAFVNGDRRLILEVYAMEKPHSYVSLVTIDKRGQISCSHRNDPALGKETPTLAHFKKIVA